MYVTFDTSLIIPKNISSFSRIVIEDIYNLPMGVPSIYTISKLTGKVNILNSSIIDTASGTSFEGVYLTGKKIFVEGILNLKVEYLSLDITNSVHLLNLKFPFKHCFVVSSDYSDFEKIFVNAYIEALNSLIVDNDNVYLSANILLTAETM